jgi:hypothetical protein
MKSEHVEGQHLKKREEELWAIDTQVKRQVGGTHYSNTAIQPVEYILANSLPFCEGNVIKYVSRWRTKGGIEDLRKARQYIDFLIGEEMIDSIESPSEPLP